MEIKDKRNIELITGNYYRPSGSDKKAAQNAMRIRMPKENRVWSGMAVLGLYYSRVTDVLVTFLEKTMDSIKVQLLHYHLEARNLAKHRKTGSRKIWTPVT